MEVAEHCKLPSSLVMRATLEDSHNIREAGTRAHRLRVRRMPGWNEDIMCQLLWHCKEDKA
jgi:hypothetical protein